MVRFEAIIKKFEEKGEKSGWTYIEVEEQTAQQLKPGTKKAFRVKGKLDKHPVEGLTLLPMGGGNFLIPLNATLRKAIRKGVGDSLKVDIQEDKKEKPLSTDLLECLEEEPLALDHFNKLTRSHQKYFSDYIESAKTIETKTKRITQALKALALGWDYGQMIRANKSKKDELKDI